MRTYQELVKFIYFEERYEYLKLDGRVGDSTFGYDRYLNQLLYSSSEWRRVRREVIIRDNGCDLGVDGYEINDKIIIHHMNPIDLSDVKEGRDIVYNPNFLISTSSRTHNAIHYGDKSILPLEPIIRTKNDTTLWR